MTAYVSFDFEFVGLKKSILAGDEAVSFFCCTHAEDFIVYIYI